MNKNPHISIVSPVYRGEKMVAELVQRNVERVFNTNNCLEYDEE